LGGSVRLFDFSCALDDERDDDDAKGVGGRRSRPPQLKERALALDAFPLRLQPPHPHSASIDLAPANAADAYHPASCTASKTPSVTAGIWFTLSPR
jgi:hypothetical protein